MARNLEPYRGFHSFLRVAENLLQMNESLNIVIIGSEDGDGYGASPSSHRTWKEYYAEECSSVVHSPRVHFLGSLPYNEYLHICKNSMVHLYLSYPFVLSWSVLEIMYLQTPIVANNIPMIREVIQHEHTGLLADFFDYKSLSTLIQRLVNDSKLRDCIGKQASLFAKSNFDARNSNEILRSKLLNEIKN